MNPIYKFQLTAGGDSRQAYPVYRDDLAIDYALETNQEFYRGKLSGKLTFQRDDYTFIVEKSFDTQFDVVISISYNGGQTWAEYWHGQFWKTDCQFNDDEETAIVTPTVKDRYNDILAGMEKEYNLIDLVPEIAPIKLDKRSMIQVYVPGTTVVACFLSGMWWEQECEKVEETDTVEIEIEGQTYTVNKLEYYLDFAKNRTQQIVNVSGSMSPTLPDEFNGVAPENLAQGYEFTSGGYKFKYTWTNMGQYVVVTWEIVRISDNVTLWEYGYSGQHPPTTYPMTITLQPVSGTGATGNVTLYIHNISVFARRICDVETIQGLQTYELPPDDLVENNRNYRRAIGYYAPDTIAFASYLSPTPTKWGIYQPGQYYDTPSTMFVPEWFPIARAVWGRFSIWFAFSAIDWYAEERSRAGYVLRHAYPLASVISVLLAKIASSVTHAETTDYSRFLYDTNPITSVNQRIFITPKSNMVSLGYDQPAQKAPITLKRVLDMLRDCFRCYWFVDENNRFRIEHISWFMNGGAYPGTPDYPVVGMDLTTLKETRNGKPWSYVRNQYQFDKPEMAARYQFGWMDDVTQLFDGYPIDIISKYVNPDNVEQIDVSQFTSDVDYIMLNPGEISKDGFVLLCAIPVTTSAINNPGPITIKSGATPVVIAIEPMFLPTSNYVRFTLDITNTSADNVVFSLDAFIGDNIFYSYGFQTQYMPSSGTYTFGLDLPPTITKIRFSYSSGSGEITFTLVSVSANANGYQLPYLNFGDYVSPMILQNAYAAFAYLQRYYMFDMPAYNVKINGIDQWVYGVKKLKSQTIKFPVLHEPNMTNLIKTGLGNGTIQKMSVNLSSRNANTTLKYDTE